MVSKIGSGLVLFSLLMALTLGVAFAAEKMAGDNNVTKNATENMTNNVTKNVTTNETKNMSENETVNMTKNETENETETAEK